MSKEGILRLVFENDGKTVHKSTEGFEGPQCEKLTSFIEAALGAKDVERHHTEEYDKGNKFETEDGLLA